MSKKVKEDICKVCGQYKKLTFEHVPPKATYNKAPVKLINMENILDAESDERMPWDLDNIYGKISQSGKGGYYLCNDCNNKTGAWYASHYNRFVEAVMSVAVNLKGKEDKSVVINMADMRLLPIFKQIITMFCDINTGYSLNDPAIREFILNKENNKFDFDKYRVFMYIPKGSLERTVSKTSRIVWGLNGEKNYIIVSSEIVSYPVGFALYYNLPGGYKPKGTDITNFAKCNYEEKSEIILPLDQLDINTVFIGDYRDKSEIMKDIEENKKFVND